MFRKAAVSLLAAVWIAACADRATAPVVPPAVANTPLAVPFTAPSFATVSTSVSSAPLSAIWRPVITGATPEGALYAFYVPRDWNGDVVYYAHGIRLPSEPVDLNLGDSFTLFREALGERHFAVAFSSYSENGFAVKDGIARTAGLRHLFRSLVGRARHSYLTGSSLGGLIVEGIAEQEDDGEEAGDWQDNKYDGTLAMCAPLGGSASEINYLLDMRVLFDWFYPGVVPGNAMYVPPGTNANAALYAMQNAVIADRLRGLGAMARIEQTPMEGTTATELLTDLGYAIKYNILALDDLLAHTRGEPFYDNSRTVYSSRALPTQLLAAINAPAIGVGRFTATPAALNYLEMYYKPTGRLRVPTITLHTVNDPFVPRRKHEAEFRAAVAASDASALLLQRSVPGEKFGHCTFTVSEMTDAFDALTKWVETGVKPAS